MKAVATRRMVIMMAVMMVKMVMRRRMEAQACLYLLRLPRETLPVF